MEKQIPDKIVKFDKHKHKRSRWITRGIVNCVTFRDKLFDRLKKLPPNSLEQEILKTNLSTYNNILNKNIRIAKKVTYESCFEKYKNNMCKTWSTIFLIQIGKRRHFQMCSKKKVDLLVANWKLQTISTYTSQK